MKTWLTSRQACLKALTPFLLFALGISPQISHAQDPIVALAEISDKVLVVSYDKNGNALRQLSLAPNLASKVISGKWSSTSEIAALAKEGSKDHRIRFFDFNGAVINEYLISNGALHTLIVCDVDQSGYDDLIAIKHDGTRSVAAFYYNPGISSAEPLNVPLASQGVYYSAAYNGATAVGLFAYSPAGAITSAATKKRGKKKKKPAAKGPRVDLLNFQGAVITSIGLKKAADAQIYSYSTDGTAGFAIADAGKIKLYNSKGGVVKDITIPVGAEPAFGNFSASTALKDLLVTETSRLKFIDLITGLTSYADLKGLPSQIEIIDAEIDKLRDELVAGYRNGASTSEMIKIRDRMLALEMEKMTLSTSSALASKLTRIFTSGAGAIEGVCDVVFDNPSDGYGGFLAKNGDFNGKAVFLTPGGKNYINAELIKFKTYKLITKLKDSGSGNPDSHGFRKHFRGNVNLQALGGSYIFRAQVKESIYSDTFEKHCWFIKSKATRID